MSGGVPCCAGPIQGTGGGGGGGGETLAETLVIGELTGGTDIIVTTGDAIVGETVLNLEGGDAVVLGPGGDVNASAGAAIGANQAGGNVTLNPSVPTGAGAPGVAAVGSRTIITRLVNAGAGATVSLGKSTPGVDGVDNGIAGIVGANGITATLVANDIVIDGAGIVANLPAIDVARTTSKSITGTPSGLAFNSEQGGGFDAAIYTWTSGDDDIEVDNDGQYLIHGEMSMDGTNSFEAGFVLDWFKNGAAIADGAHEHTTTIGAFNEQTAMVSSTIIRTLVATDTIGFRVSRDFGSGGTIIQSTARLNIVRLS